MVLSSGGRAWQADDTPGADGRRPRQSPARRSGPQGLREGALEKMAKARSRGRNATGTRKG